MKITHPKASDNIQDILDYYSRNDENQRVHRHQLEFSLMRRSLKSYLSSRPLKILELGAGAGFYTEILVTMGHEVTALEPTKALIEQNKKNLADKKLDDRVQFVHADARELSQSVQGSFDVILNMGPFYHLEKKEDRELVLNSSKNLLKPEGLHWSVFLSRAGYTSYVLNRQPDSLMQDPDGFRDILTQGYFSNHPRNGTFRGYFTDLNEVSDLHETCGFKIQKLHALDPCIGGDDEVFNRLDDEQKIVWSEVLFALSTDPGFWGSARTWLVISSVG